MAHARISANLPPNIDPTKAPLAFGRRALPKLKEELCSPELLTQQQALMSLCDLVHNPEIVYQALEIGFLDNLKALLVHHDSTVRQKTTEILYVTAMHSVGRQGLIRQGVIPALTELLDDPVDICRKNTHQILEMMAKLPEDDEQLFIMLHKHHSTGFAEFFLDLGAILQVALGLSNVDLSDCLKNYGPYLRRQRYHPVDKCIM